MKLALAATAALVLAVCALALPGRASATTTVTRLGTLQSNVAARINRVRAYHGVRRLRVIRSLASASSGHDRVMALHGYFSHNWYTGVSFGTWIRWYYPGPGYTSWSAGENLYWTTRIPTARRVVRAWMNSGGHRANVLGRWRHLGVAVFRVKNPPGIFRSYSAITIVTADFGRRS